MDLFHVDHALGGQANDVCQPFAVLRDRPGIIFDVIAQVEGGIRICRKPAVPVGENLADSGLF